LPILEKMTAMNETPPAQDTAAPIDQPPLKGVAKMIADAEKKLREAEETYKREIGLLARMSIIIDSLPDDIADKASIYCGILDFDRLTREQSLRVISTLAAGRWKKSVNDSLPETIDYETQIDGLRVRLWSAGPPDSCRVIEVEEIVPETKIIRRKLVCSDVDREIDTVGRFSNKDTV
jgi:hypothetical protein